MGVGAIFTFALAAEIATRATGLVGVQGAHVQQARHPGGATGVHDQVHQFHMKTPEGLGLAAFVEDAEEIDHCIAVAELLGQGPELEEIGADQFETRVDLQLAMALGVAGDDTTGDTLSAQAGGQVLPDESTAAHNTDPVCSHSNDPL